MFYHLHAINSLTQTLDLFFNIKLYVRKLYTKLTRAQISAIISLIVFFVFSNFALIYCFESLVIKNDSGIHERNTLAGLFEHIRFRGLFLIDHSHEKKCIWIISIFNQIFFQEW